jgi:hypothetical protein
MYHAAIDPPSDQIRFWLTECRTPDLLTALVKKYPKAAEALLDGRPLLNEALLGREKDLQRKLREEEDLERERDREYWAPLRKELEQFRKARVREKREE